MLVKGGKGTVHADRRTADSGESLSHTSWQFKSLLWGISSGLPLANHFDVPGITAHMWYILGSSHVCAHIS